MKSEFETFTSKFKKLSHIGTKPNLQNGEMPCKLFWEMLRRNLVEWWEICFKMLAL